MYPLSETQAAATEMERQQMEQGESRYGFRPLALPALAAATLVRKPVAKAAAVVVAERQGILAIVHEDAPLA
ncbi:hypothetical protein [Methylobacterium trifolii]|uniref:Uncharacterized protein n=1 Tax=Methylobacterium trifolii TaxID=1003092 RepID=A0ABQ4TXB0_9HYPH|nr:hypothetical protein [Methylobacterium trifolii]GJE59696.1 hypothetical protein MPOCJGCO_1797 [Methylobacterium trifolii]